MDQTNRTENSPMGRNRDNSPTKRIPPMKEPKKEEEMVLKKPKTTATDQAAHTKGTSTVTDGEAG